VAAAVRARRILVVTYPYPPMPSVGGNRWLAMSKYLRRAGHEVEILTTGAFGALTDDRERGVHRTGDLIAAGWLRTLLRRPPLPQPGVAAAEDTPAPAIATKTLVPDMYVATWVPYAVAAARRLLRERSFDCIVTTSAYESTHLVPLALGPARPPWVADFRDGWTFHPHKPPYPSAAQRRLDVALERRVVTTAERTIVVERPVGEDLRARLGVHAVHVPNGWDPELADEARAASSPPLDPDRVMLVHTGKLSGAWGRHPGTLFEAMALLRERSPAAAARISLVLAGRLDAAERQLIESAGLAEMLLHVGQLSRGEAMALQRRGDALVLITAPDLVWELPGKLFEYIGAERPVLALADGNEAARVVRETGIGWTVPPLDVAAIARALERIAAGELRMKPDAAALARYVYPAPAIAAAEQIERAMFAREMRRAADEARRAKRGAEQAAAHQHGV
jgi:glycosyltransferase involved in cell wall biosynthesis